MCIGYIPLMPIKPPTKNINPVLKAVNILGGPVAVTSELGLKSPTSVYQMIRTRRVNIKHLGPMLDLLDQRAPGHGLTAHELNDYIPKDGFCGRQ